MQIKSASRTLITLGGRIRNGEIAAVLETLDEHDFIDVRHAFDETTHETKLWLYPCKTYVVEYGNGDDSIESCERKVVLKGSLPKDLRFISDHWMPFRKQAKRSEDNTRYVALTIKDVFKHEVSRESSEADYTELCLIVDGRCPEEERSEALNRAANFVCDELRAIVETVSPAYMQSARTLDKVSCDIADKIAEKI